MAALTGPRNLTNKLSERVLPDLYNLPIQANVWCHQGGIMVLDGGSGGGATGYLRPGRTAVGDICVGRMESMEGNGSPGSGGNNLTQGTWAGTAGLLSVFVRQGVFNWDNSAGADAITQQNAGQPAYIVDDHTVALTDGNGTRSFAGVIQQVDTVGVWVLMGIFDVPRTAVGGAAPPNLGTGGAYNPVRFCRLVTPAALAAYTNVSGVLTANANGALATIDGVAPAVGDRILLSMGAAAVDNGIYVVTSLGSAGSKWVLTRASDFETGNVFNGLQVNIGSEGTAFANTKWILVTTGAITVMTTGLSFYPAVLKGTSAAMVAGSVTISSNIWLLAGAQIEATINTIGGTGFLKVTGASRTAGVGGTGQFIITSTVGTDTSTVDWMVVNVAL